MRLIYSSIIIVLITIFISACGSDDNQVKNKDIPQAPQIAQIETPPMPDL